MNRPLLLTVVGLITCAAVLLTTGCAPEGEKKQADKEQAVGKADKSDIPEKVEIPKEYIGAVREGMPFSPAVKIGNTLYVSGQVPIDPGTGEEVRGDVKAQTRKTLENIQALVEQAGFRMEDVVRATVFITDMDLYADMNSVYLEFFPKNPPARACVAVKELVRDFLVEISCIAQR
jgi:2-iminobutanoate/2-iminopropanoate deaminase